MTDCCVLINTETSVVLVKSMGLSRPERVEMHGLRLEKRRRSLVVKGLAIFMGLSRGGNLGIGSCDLCF